MKKSKAISAIAGALLFAVVAGFSGCSGKGELSNYHGETNNADGSMLYNQSLFYSNSVQQGGPDPQVLDDTARSGYYYLFSTLGSFHTMRSTNLTEWEDVGPTFFQRQNQEVSHAVGGGCQWAPEVIYDDPTDNDADDGTYYMFFSATPTSQADWEEYNKIPKEDRLDTSVKGVVDDQHTYNMYVATSKTPAGPYTLMKFDRNFNKAGGIKLTEMTAADEYTGKYAWVKEDDGYYRAAFPQFYADYCLFDPEELYKFNDREGVKQDEGMIWGSGYYGNIDPHPYVDPVSKKKYLYCNMTRPTGIMVVEMQDWLTPKMETAKIVAIDNYYTVEEWKEDRKNGNTAHYGVSYESVPCNEGPHVIYHEDKNGKGLYYLTFSIGDYNKSAYSVAMAIAENPMGPFRKLQTQEGALLLSSSNANSKSISGAGHHSFVTLGDQLFIVYHRHVDFGKGGNNRYTAVDEMKWITVKDINGNDMDIPYVNGPTDSIQPQPVAYSGYKNVAPEATVTCSEEKAETKYVNDGLLSVLKTADADFMKYIGETEITQTATFTFKFKEAQSVRAIMVYNSAKEKKIFRNVSKIELIPRKGSAREITNLAFDMERYCQFLESGSIRYVMSGSSVFAEFNEIKVNTVKVTVEVPAGQKSVGISEIRILAKA